MKGTYLVWQFVNSHGGHLRAVSEDTGISFTLMENSDGTFQLMRTWPSANGSVRGKSETYTSLGHALFAAEFFEGEGGLT